VQANLYLPRAGLGRGYFPQLNWLVDAVEDKSLHSWLEWDGNCEESRS